MAPSCYKCDAPATTVEHVPPICFYPKDRRTNVFTVPSCATHNEDNAKDIEYVRNFIVSMSGTNEVAAELFDTAKRSYDRSPKLFQRTFQKYRPVLRESVEVAAVPMDFSRLETVIKAIAYALYHKDNKPSKFILDWRVFSPTLQSANVVFGVGPDGWAETRELLGNTNFVDFPVPDPK